VRSLRKRVPSPALIALALLAAAAPAVANAIAGCIVPLAPRPEQVAESPLDARSLITALAQRTGLEFRSDAGASIPVNPEYKVFTRSSGSRPIDQGRGTTVRIAPGRHVLGRVVGSRTLEGMAAALGEAMNAGNADARPTFIRVLEHQENLRWPRDRSNLAIALDFVDAETRAEPTRSHMLVMFVTQESFGEANEREEVAPAVASDSHRHGPARAPLYGSLAALALLAAASLPRRPRP